MKRRLLSSEDIKQLEAFVEGQTSEGALFTRLLVWADDARVTEVLALRGCDFDIEGAQIWLPERGDTLGRRAFTVPVAVMAALETGLLLRARQAVRDLSEERVWSFSCRQEVWSVVKAVMAAAGLAGSAAVPRGLRYGRRRFNESGG